MKNLNAMTCCVNEVIDGKYSSISVTYPRNLEYNECRKIWEHNIINTYYLWWVMIADFIHPFHILTDSFPVFGMTQVSISCFPTITERLPVLLLISIWGGILNPIWFAVMRLRMFPLLWRTADDVSILFLVQDVVKVTDLCGEATADLKDLIKELRNGSFEFNENPWAASNSRYLILFEATS